MDIGKSTIVKSTPTRPTPQKRKQSSIGGQNKKIKLELVSLEDARKRMYSESVPSLVLSMGSGDTGQLGLGEEVLEKKRPAEISDLRDIVSIKAGGMHSVCLSRSGKVYTFGCNDEGALGRPIKEDEEATMPGEVTFKDDIVIIEITAGDNHSAVLTDKGEVYIWGSFRDNNGLIGLLNELEKVLVPTKIPIDSRIIKIASGENHFAMLNENGDILTMGVAEQGQLGRVGTNNLIRGGRHGLAPLLCPMSVRVKHSFHFCDLWAGAFSTIGKTTDGKVYGCGLNNYHQLGINEELMQLMMVPLTGFNDLSLSWTQFAFGQHHTLAFSSSQRVFTVGRGEYGSLGLGNNDHQTAVVEVPFSLPAGVSVQSIAACNRTSYALLSDGSVLSWGMGSSYQLGHGADNEDVNVPTAMTGKQIQSRTITEISPGFQHVLFRAIDKIPSGDTHQSVVPETTITEEPIDPKPDEKIETTNDSNNNAVEQMEVEASNRDS